MDDFDWDFERMEEEEAAELARVEALPADEQRAWLLNAVDRINASTVFRGVSRAFLFRKMTPAQKAQYEALLKFCEKESFTPAESEFLARIKDRVLPKL